MRATFTNKNTFGLLFLLIMISALAYGGALYNGFVQDDALFITQNGFVKSWENFPKIFTKAYMNWGNLFSPERLIGSGEVTYRPIATISYFVDYAINGMTPFGYHLTNILLHLANVLILFLLSDKLLKNKSAAFLAALIFGVHPINNEAVNIIAFRKDLFVCLFFLASFIFYIQTTETSNFPQKLWYLFSLFFFFLSLFSKEMAVTLPFLLILYDHLFLRDKNPEKFLDRFLFRYIGYFLVLSFYLGVCFLLKKNLDDYLPSFRGGSFLSNLLIVPNVIATYLAWIFYPFNLHVALTAPLHPYPLLSGKTFFAISLIFFCLVSAYALAKKNKVLSFSIFWFFLTLVPVANIVPLPTLMASHFLYLPMVGAALFLSQLAVQLAGLKTRHITNSFFRKTAGILAVAFVALCLMITAMRNPIWRNNISLWAEAARIYPEDFLAHSNWADMMRPYPDLSGYVIREYKIAIHLAPHSPHPYNQLAIAYKQYGKYALAIEFSKKALSLDPNYMPAYRNLAETYLLEKQWEAAENACREMIRLKSNSSEAFDLLGILSAYQGRYDEAIRYFDQAIKIDPYDPIAMINKGSMFFQKNQKDKAAETWQKVLRLRPDNSVAKKFLAELNKTKQI